MSIHVHSFTLRCYRIPAVWPILRVSCCNEPMVRPKSTSAQTLRIPTGDSCAHTACCTLSTVYARIADFMYAYIKLHTLVRRAKSLELQATHTLRAPLVHWVPNARHPSARTHAVCRRSTWGLCEVVQSACAHFYTRVSKSRVDAISTLRT